MPQLADVHISSSSQLATCAGSVYQSAANRKKRGTNNNLSVSVIRPREKSTSGTLSACYKVYLVRSYELVMPYHKSRRGRDCVRAPPTPLPHHLPSANPRSDLHLRACDRDRCTYVIAADERRAPLNHRGEHVIDSFIEFVPFFLAELQL